MQLWLPTETREASVGTDQELVGSLLNIDGTYMSFEAEKVQSLHSLESLPFLHRDQGTV